MKKILFFTSCIALMLTFLQGCGQSNTPSNQTPVNQEPVVQSESNNDNNQQSVVQSESNNDNNQQSVVQSESSSGNIQQSIVQSQSSSSNNQESVVQSQSSSSNNQESVVQSQSSSSNNQESVVQSPSNRDMNISRSTTKSSQYSSSPSGSTSQQSSSSSGYTSQQSSSSSGSQTNTLSLKRTNLSKPHILSIKTSGQRLIGKIIINNGELVKQLRGNEVEIDLSPYLSVGENIVEINARYAPASSTVDIEMNGPEANVMQQDSGNGIVSSNMKIMVQ